ncbi:helix-turn-helix domain-containing protein [Vibrio sp. YIC-376]|uniref:helix-turn-helix domain-containing protein n=1 Tax=Vibrio sp. YIC-376 TaxID=3136162 RepID=UPI00402AF64C
MERLAKAHWIGEPLQSLPEQFRWVFAQYFELVDHGNDISIISDKDFDHFFYYVTGNQNGSLKGAVTLCENLDKKLIVVHPNTVDGGLPPEHITSEYYSLNDNYLPHWLSQIKLKYFFNRNLEGSTRLTNKTYPRKGKSNFAEVVDYIANNAHTDIREEEAAALCHYSPTYFSKVFRRHVGMCFRDYVTAKRISLAKKMLTEDHSMKIAYIAYKCGYHDVSYFSRIFKKKTGLSPASYRQQF